MFRFTVREVLAAAKKNGLKHIRQDWFDYGKDGETIQGCILGQALYNLVGEREVRRSLDEETGLVDAFYFALNQATNGLAAEMISLNDNKTDSGKDRKYSDLVRMFERRAKDDLDKVITFEVEPSEEYSEQEVAV